MKLLFTEKFKLSLLSVLMVPITMAVYGQQGTVRGTITDASGDPIVGAVVGVQGTTLGAVSDIDGGDQYRVLGSDIQYRGAGRRRHQG